MNEHPLRRAGSRPVPSSSRRFPPLVSAPPSDLPSQYSHNWATTVHVPEQRIMTGQHGPGASLCTGGSCQETFEAAPSWPPASLWPQDEAGLDQANYSPQPNLAHRLCQPPGAALTERAAWGLNSLLSLSSGGQKARPLSSSGVGCLSLRPLVCRHSTSVSVSVHEWPSPLCLF